MLDVFRFTWFAFRTFVGVILLVLAMEAAMWVPRVASGDRRKPDFARDGGVVKLIAHRD